MKAFQVPDNDLSHFSAAPDIMEPPLSVQQHTQLMIRCKRTGRVLVAAYQMQGKGDQSIHAVLLDRYSDNLSLRPAVMLDGERAVFRGFHMVEESDVPLFTVTDGHWVR